MIMTYLKRLAAPKIWEIERKLNKWIVSPLPGSHAKSKSIPLVIILRDMLKAVRTSKEADSILNAGLVTIDGKVRKEGRLPAGLFDIVDIKGFGVFRLCPYEKGFRLVKVPSKEAKTKPCKITGMTILKGGKLQLALHDGRTLLLKEKKTKYKVGDTLVITVPDQKVYDCIKLDKGSLAVVTEGKNRGLSAKIVAIDRTLGRNMVTLADKNKSKVPLDYVFAIGSDKPAVKISE